MLLRNYYNWLAMLAMGVSSTDTSTFGDGHLNTKVLGGSLAAIKLTQYSEVVGFGNSISTSIVGSDTTSNAIIIGSGDTAVTFDDYALDSIISSGWTKGTPIVGTPAYNSGTKKWTNTISFVCTNTSGSDLTIKEIGIVARIVDYVSTTSSLIYREVLASPVTITNGTSSTITLNLEYTMPTV